MNTRLFLIFLLIPSLSISMSLEEELYNAVQCKNKGEVQRLLAEGANPLNKNTWGSIPLMAIAHDQIVDAQEIQDILMQYNLSEQVKMRDSKGRTLLHVASRNFNRRLVQLFIKAGAAINDQENEWRSTPLCEASDVRWERPAEHQSEVVKMLLMAGADPRLKDSQQRTALTVAELYGSTNIIPLLEKKLASYVDVSTDEEVSVKQEEQTALRRSARIQLKTEKR